MNSPQPQEWFRDICRRLDNKDEILTNLNLNIRRVDRLMMEELSNVLHKSQSLEVLNLTSSITDHADALVPLLQIALPLTTSLQVLHLSYNQIQDLHDLGSSLASNCSLVELYFDYNAINSNGAVHIAEGLQFNRKLELLQLNHNSIGDTGASSLAHALTTNNSLRRLNLHNNSIHDRGGESLKCAIASNRFLHRCELDGKSVSTDYTDFIEVICSANKAGQQLVGKRNNTVFFPFVLARAGSNCAVFFYMLRMNLHVIDYKIRSNTKRLHDCVVSNA